MSQSAVGQIENLMVELTWEEQLLIFERLAKQLRLTAQQPEKIKRGQDLYGIWRDKFPSDFDIDAVLDEIRHDWETRELNL